MLLQNIISWKIRNYEFVQKRENLFMICPQNIFFNLTAIVKFNPSVVMR